MIVRNSEIKMPSSKQTCRIDTLELKARIVKKLGHQKSEKYFYLLRKLLSLKITKFEFEKVCISIIGRENVALHNGLIGSIIKNACVAKTPPSIGCRVEGLINVKPAYGCRRSSPHSPGGDMFALFPCQGKSSNLKEQKVRDCPSPIGHNGKTQSVVWDESVPRTQEQQSATELVSLGSRPLGEVVSVEDGEEVEQIMGSPSVQSRSPVRPPLGIPTNVGGARKALRSSSITSFRPEMCRNSYELPDSRSLRKRLERKLEMEGLSISMDCANLLNNGLDAFLKRLIQPCIEITRSKHEVEHLRQVNGCFKRGLNGVLPEAYVQRSRVPMSATLLDFRVATELNPQVLGDDWSFQIEKICLRALEE